MEGYTGAAGGWAATDEGDLVRSILDRTVGPFRMDDTHFSAFVTDIETRRGEGADAKFALYRAVSAAGPGNALPYAPAGVRERFEAYERTVVSNFLTRTDYLKIDPRAERVSFIAEAACRSPFARFDAA